jgi:hypothetical protein
MNGMHALCVIYQVLMIPVALFLPEMCTPRRLFLSIILCWRGYVSGLASIPMSQVPDAVALSQAAVEQVKVLSDQLKAIPNIPSCLAICCMRTAASIALQRASLLSKVLPSLLGVATRGVLKTPSVGDGQSSVTASMGVTLKDVLVRVLRSGVDAAKPWRKRLSDALKGMGAEAQAESAMRHLDRLERCVRDAVDSTGGDCICVLFGACGAMGVGIDDITCRVGSS